MLAAINTPESYKVLQTYKGCKKPGVIDALINIASETFGQRKIIEEFIREVQPEELQLYSPDTFDGLELLDKLKELYIHGDVKNLEWQSLSKIENLSSLSLFNLSNLEDLSFLPELKNLSSLSLDRLSKLEDLSLLAKLPKLETLQRY